MAEPVPLGPDPALTELAEEEPDDSLVAELRDLAGDVQTMVEAELAFQSARAGYVAGRGKTVLAWLAVALVALVLASIALVVGLLLALAPLIGAWGALAAVTLCLLALAVFAALLARARVQRIRALAFPAKPAA